MEAVQSSLSRLIVGRAAKSILGLGSRFPSCEPLVTNVASTIFSNSENLHNDVYIGNSIFEFKSQQDVASALAVARDNLRRYAGKSDNTMDFVKSEVKKIDLDLLNIVRSMHSDVSSVSRYLLDCPSKRFRPALHVLVNLILKDVFPSASDDQPFSQCHRMVAVVELIHTASMMHDDVLDDSDVRRGQTSTHRQFSNKKAILGGDFLLARACKVAASFGIPEAFQRTAEIVENLVKGELIQAGGGNSRDLKSSFGCYLTKTYYKTASLMAEGAACGALIGGFDSSVRELAFRIGSSVGMAFQIYDDLLDVKGDLRSLGKPTFQDIQSNLFTAPLFMASFDRPDDVLKLLSRGLRSDEDKLLAKNIIIDSSAVPRTMMLVHLYIRHTLSLLESLPTNLETGHISAYSRALVGLIESTIAKE